MTSAQNNSPNTATRVSASDWFLTYDHLGNHYPFYAKNDPKNLATDIGPAIEQIPQKERQIDPVGVAEFLINGHMLGNRTLLKNVRRAPWMGRPDGCGNWIYADVPEHGNLKINTEEAAERLRKALHREALKYLSGRNTVGILLSGGLDSRIVAGIVRELQLCGDFPGNVVALTWGVEGCRDVIYAADIAKRYDWDWIHFRLGPETLKENIQIAAISGAEYAPFHLHALPQVARLDGLEAVLAGSYGDSVGRAEFSGLRVKQLKPIITSKLDRLGILRAEVKKDILAEIEKDAYGYRQYVFRHKEYQYRELEQQMHYMRRQLQACMSYAGARIPLYQLFTAPETFGLMWGLDPNMRDDGVYYNLLPKLPGRIADIPWTRTGRPLGVTEGAKDDLPKEHHQYGRWLRRDLAQHIVSLIRQNHLNEVGIFNEKTLNWLLNVWQQSSTITTNGLDEIVSWLASLTILIKQYKIKTLQPTPPSWRDQWNTGKGYVIAKTYQSLRNRLRS